MRKLLLLILPVLINCTTDTDVQPDAGDGLCVLTHDTVCHGTWEIAEAYCSRQDICFNNASDTCIEDVMRSLCAENDCSAYYPESNQVKLRSCIMQYLQAPCGGPSPPECKLY